MEYHTHTVKIESLPPELAALCDVLTELVEELVKQMKAEAAAKAADESKKEYY